MALKLREWREEQNHYHKQGNGSARMLCVDFFFKLAQIFNQAGAAARFARNTGIAAVENKPVVAVDFKFGGNDL